MTEITFPLALVVLENQKMNQAADGQAFKETLVNRITTALQNLEKSYSIFPILLNLKNDFSDFQRKWNPKWDDFADVWAALEEAGWTVRPQKDTQMVNGDFAIAISPLSLDLGPSPTKRTSKPKATSPTAEGKPRRGRKPKGPVDPADHMTTHYG